MLGRCWNHIMFDNYWQYIVTNLCTIVMDTQTFGSFLLHYITLQYRNYHCKVVNSPILIQQKEKG